MGKEREREKDFPVLISTLNWTQNPPYMVINGVMVLTGKKFLLNQSIPSCESGMSIVA